MIFQKSQKIPLISIYTKSFELIKKSPRIFLPFIIFTLLESIILIFISIAPRTPDSILGPVISTIWGEKFLYYPDNLLLLPKLLSLCRIALYIAFSSLLSAIAVAMVSDGYRRGSLCKLGTAVITAIKKYVYFFTLALTVTIVFYASKKLLAIFLMKFCDVSGLNLSFVLDKTLWAGPIAICTNAFFALIFQAAFIYAVPEMIIAKEKFIKAIVKSVILFKKTFITTSLLVGLPMLAYIPIILLNYNAGFLIQKTHPWSMFIILFLGIAANSLIIDSIVITSSTVFYLMKTQKQGA